MWYCHMDDQDQELEPSLCLRVTLGIILEIWEKSYILEMWEHVYICGFMSWRRD